MAVLSITASVSCDDCGKHFKADIDPAHSCRDGFEAVCEALRGGEGSYDDGIMRCQDCTSVADRKWIAAHLTFISGVRKSAGGWTVTTYDEVEHFVSTDHPMGEPQVDFALADHFSWFEREAA